MARDTTKHYSPANDIPDLSGKVILITGGTAGLGAQTILSLAAHSPAHIFFTGRDKARADSLIRSLNDKIPITFIPMDLVSLSSVQAGAKQILSLTTRLDILIANAGVYALPPGLTTDGYELQFGINHLSHALLLKYLLPLLLETAKKPDTDVRVVFLSSLGFTSHPPGGIIFDNLKTPQNFLIGGPWIRYGQSKLANQLYAAELARRYKDSRILFVSIHPGEFKNALAQMGFRDRALVWMTSLGNVKDEKKDGEGSWTTCWAATCERGEIENGGYYEPVGVKGKRFRENGNVKLAGKLYEWTQKELLDFN